MRDVSEKPNSLRTARAEGTLRCSPATLEAVRSGNVPKADPLGVARVAGIQAAKQTSLIIPYCHHVPLDFVGVEISLEEDVIHVAAEVKAVWKTGVEMEALAAASAALLTLYDMLKIIDKEMEIRTVRLVAKKGGKSDAPGVRAGLRGAVLVLSDSCASGEREDRSGKAIADRLRSMGVDVAELKILPDDAEKIEKELIRLADTVAVDLILTTGGTGLGPRDQTPEATRKVVSKEIPGIVEALRSHGQERTRFSMFSRGIAGIRGKTLVVNFPGSTKGVNESMDVLFPWVLHSFEMIRGGGH